MVINVLVKNGEERFERFKPYLRKLLRLPVIWSDDNNRNQNTNTEIIQWVLCICPFQNRDDKRIGLSKGSTSISWATQFLHQ